MACRYMAVEARAEWVMKFWVPLLIGVVSICCILIEFRVGYQYIGLYIDEDNFQPDAQECGAEQ
jgi:hypothetical protein